MIDEYCLSAAKDLSQRSHLYFTRYFFKQRNGTKFIVNWHHALISSELEKVITGETENLIITVSPGSSKTELAIINFIARGLAINPMARFLHLSYSDDLALLNSQAAREIIRSDEYQRLWPLEIASDTKSKKRWNVMHNGKLAGGVYATSLSGQVTGFRAGHMAPGFQGAILIDDPMKPEEAFSKTKLEAANRKLLTTVKSRRANPKTPIIVIMQRLSESDPVGFIEQGGLQGNWKHVKIPALIDDNYIELLPKEFRDQVARDVRNPKEQFSYWEYKEPVSDLTAMESGHGRDSSGNQISRHVFSSQYQQNPVAMGGNIFKGKDFVRFAKMPRFKHRLIFGDTASKTKEANDYSVFQCWGMGHDGKIYLIDQIRGKWEAPELLSRSRAFWAKHHNDGAFEPSEWGSLRYMYIEDKASGTGLIQTLKLGNPREKQPPIPVKGIERSIDKYTRACDGLPYIEAGMVCVPEDAPFTNDFIAEHEAFTANDSHAYDDQIDPCMDAINAMLSSRNKINIWENLA